jgi:DNA-binding NarL/FixJ family response regulator
MTAAVDQSTTAPKTRILIIDDHPVVRKGLGRLLESQETLSVSAEAGTPAEALALMQEKNPDLAIVDLSLGDFSGIELIERLHRLAASMPILALSMHEEAVYVERALRAGASGYVMKKEATEKILEAIESVMRGELYVSEEMKNTLVGRIVTGSSCLSEIPFNTMTAREMDIFRLVSKALSNRQIADMLHLSNKTVETHCEHIKQKLGLKSRRELGIYAVQWAKDLPKED